MVDIPVELFLGFTAIAVIFAVSGLMKRIPIMIFIGGVFMLSLFIATDNIIMGFISGGGDTIHYNVLTNTVTPFINAVQRSIVAEYPSTSSSELWNKEFDCISVFLAKTGAPPNTDTVKIGIFDATGTLLQQFGTSIDVSELQVAPSFFLFEKCLPEGETYLIPSNPGLVERIGVSYNAGDAANTVVTRSDGNNPFDGTVTFRQSFLLGVWSSTTTEDISMILKLRGEDVTNQPYEFTEFVKMIYALFASILMLVGWLIYKTN